MVNRRTFLKFLSASIPVVLWFPTRGKEFFARDFYPDGELNSETHKRNALVMFQRAAKKHGYTSIEKIKLHPIVWDVRRIAWDVTYSAILS